MMNKSEKAAYMRKYNQRNKSKLSAQRKVWREANRERVLQYKKNYRTKNQTVLAEKQTSRYYSVQRPRDNQAILEALKIYEGKCEVCGWDDVVILQWHHRGGDRKTHNESNVDVSKRVVEAGRQLEDVMLLCSNCHIYQDLEDGTSNKSSRMMEIAELWGS